MISNQEKKSPHLIYFLFFYISFILLCSCGEETSCGETHHPVYDRTSLQSFSFPDVGAGQGLQVIDNYIYLFGDSTSGIVQELDMDLNPTGWKGELTVDGEDVIAHPTGFAYQEGYPTFIGTGGTLYLIDWEIFYTEKNLNHALLRTIRTSQEQVRPEYVFYDGSWYIASAQYLV